MAPLFQSASRLVIKEAPIYINYLWDNLFMQITYYNIILQCSNGIYFFGLQSARDVFGVRNLIFANINHIPSLAIFKKMMSWSIKKLLY